MKPVDRVKAEVQRQYESSAEVYRRDTRIQDGMLDYLIRLLQTATATCPPARLLDVGCGTGLLAREVTAGLFGADCKYWGIDFSWAMLAEAARQCPSPACKFVPADAESLPFPASTFDLVISNSVLHWLNAPEHTHTPGRAVAEMRRVLLPGGLAAASISGTGTGSAFLRAYREVVDGFRASADVDDLLYRHDPVGSMRLDQVVQTFRENDLPVQTASMRYQPVVYGDPREYAAAVKAYGYQQFVGAITSAKRQAELVNNFETPFRRI